MITGLHESAHRIDRQADEGQRRPASSRKACPREPPAGFGTSGRCSAGCEVVVRPEDMGAGVARLAGQTSFEDDRLVQTPFFCFGLLLLLSPLLPAVSSPVRSCVSNRVRRATNCFVFMNKIASMASPDRKVYLSQEEQKAKAEEDDAADRQRVYEAVLSCIIACDNDRDRLLAKMPLLQIYFDTLSDLRY